MYVRLLVCLSLFVSLSLNLLAQAKINNPILPGFYPDPSICRVGKDYYLVTSTFSYYPGIPVFHSYDLASWTQIGFAMNRPDQLNLDGQGVSRGLFAPAIRYNKGTYYITCTQVDKGGNFIITAKKPTGPWSNPIWLPEVNGIDPSMFFDDNGKAYILYNSIPPDNKSLYSGHRTIRMYEVDTATLKVKGEERMLVNGGVDISKKPVWIEAPHIFKKGSYYYLLCAEGGTGYDHSEVVFRSTNAEGPYVPYEKNPILTQRHLNPKRKNPVTSTGHADLVETSNGEWWAVFLGCRPYTEDYYNLGRETFIAPVLWKDGWPIINPGYEEVQYSYPIGPYTQDDNDEEIEYDPVMDQFRDSVLDYQWQFLRTPHEKWYSLDDHKGQLTMKLRPEMCTDKVNPSFLGRRQQSLYDEASASVSFDPKSDNEKAGILIFQNESHFYYLCKSVEDKHPVVQLYKSVVKGGDTTMELITSEQIPRLAKKLKLKIEARGDNYSFWYGSDPGKWVLLAGDIDAKFLSTKVAGGFVGCMYALYATSSGKPSNANAYFYWFRYAVNKKWN